MAMASAIFDFIKVVVFDAKKLLLMHATLLATDFIALAQVVCFNKSSGWVCTYILLLLL